MNPPFMANSAQWRIFLYLTSIDESQGETFLFSSASKLWHQLTSVADLQLHSLYLEATISRLCNAG